MTIRKNIQKASQSRLFSFTGGAGPSVRAEYQGLGIGGTFTWPLGATTPVRVPSDKRYGDFTLVDRIRAQRGLPLLNIENRLTRDLSEFLALAKSGCDLDIQLHIGACEDPTDFLHFDKVMVLESAVITDYALTQLGAMDGNQEAAVSENLPFEGVNYYEVAPLLPEEVAAVEIFQEVVGVAMPDVQSCGECGLPTDGGSIVFALCVAVGGSPGLPAKIVFTQDGWKTVGSTFVTSLPANMNPSGIAVCGTDLVVISNDDESLHYASLIDVLNGVETWTRVATGFVAAKGPNAIFSLGRSFTWMVGDGGYIYFTDDVTTGVVAQTNGSATAENLNAIHGWDSLNLVAVGENNAVLLTDDGGQANWTALIGPAIGIDLDSIAMRTQFSWLVGDDAGSMWYTQDGGATWKPKLFPHSGTGAVKALAFSTAIVGYAVHNVGGRGYLLRTIDGGNSWYRLSERAGINLPNNVHLNALAVVGPDFKWGPNRAEVGGLAVGGLDGIMIQVAA